MASRHLAREKTKPCKANNQGTPMSYYRTPEHRALRAAMIRRWKPWEKSTGPNSDTGKAKVSRNAYKGGESVLMREIRQALREQAEMLKRIE